MKTKIITTAALVCCFVVCAAAVITDLSGKWTGSVRVEGTDHKLDFAFKIDGSKLTGTTHQDQDDDRPINEGKINGPDFTFSVSNKDGETFPIKGVYYAEGDSISLIVDYQGGKLHIPLKRADK